MSLQSNLFKGDQALEACLVRDSAHLTLNARGEAVHKVQRVVLVLGKRGIENTFFALRCDYLNDDGHRSVFKDR